MADVRLTALNPADSTVVPVACNAAGEILIDKPVINEIDNDVTINGVLSITQGEGEPAALPKWQYSSNGTFAYANAGLSTGTHSWQTNGYTVHRRTDSGCGKVTMMRLNDAIVVQNENLQTKWYVDYEGNGLVSSLQIALEADNSAHYVQAASREEDGATEQMYKGPALNVGEELLSLKAQVRSLMEKLNMTPEGG